jgi:hypothetical protein
MSGLPLGFVTDHLDEATGWLRVILAAQREADAELEALWTLAVGVWDLVLGSADMPSSLATSMSTAAELLEGGIDAAAANGVCSGTCSVLVAIGLHFQELKTEL